MKALVLEDNALRIKSFKERFLEHQIIADYCSNVQDCISLLNREKYDLVFLDHDLSEEYDQDPNDTNTGSKVARWIAKNPLKSKIFVHSLSKNGSKFILDLLPEAKYVPWVWKEDNIFWK